MRRDSVAELSRLNTQLTRLTRRRLRALERAHLLSGQAAAIGMDIRDLLAVRLRLERRLDNIHDSGYNPWRNDLGWHNSTGVEA